MPAKSVRPAKVRVLLLEDDPAFEVRVVESLRDEGYEVLVASNRRQAIEVSSTGNIDAVVLDLDIPSKGLRQLVAKLNAGEPRGRTLVIARSLEQLILASEAGADVVLMRPLDSDRIGRVMNNLLAGMHTQTLTERWLHDDTGLLSQAPDWPM